MTETTERYQVIKTVTLVGGLVNFILAIIKMLIGKLAFSHALFVDGIHSLSDLLSDLLVLYAAKKGNQKPDEDHPYGHARIETFFTVVFGCILISVGLGILLDAVNQLIETKQQPLPTSLALIVALISVVSKEALYQYTLFYAKKYHSSLLKANAWHHRSDAVSSIVVLVGVVGSMYAVPYLDLAAAIIVAMMIAKIGWDLVYESVNELVDKGLDKEDLEQIKEIVESIPGIDQMHSLRSRQMGGKALVDVHIQVLSHISVSEGHRISDEVMQRLIKEIESVSQVLVHVDPENDEENSPCYELPLRDKVVTEFLKKLQQYIDTQGDTLSISSHFLERLQKIIETSADKSMILHYYQGSIELQVFFDFSDVSDDKGMCLHSLSDFEQHLNQFLKQQSCEIKSVKFGLLN